MTVIRRQWRGREIEGEPDVVETAIDELEQARTKRAAVDKLWGNGGSAERMSRLCETLPTLRGVPGTRPWDAMALLRWLCTSGAVTSGSGHAARFVLQVWCADQDWAALATAPESEQGLGLRADEMRAIEPFNPVAALAVWDWSHSAAFVMWCQLPFWP